MAGGNREGSDTKPVSGIDQCISERAPQRVVLATEWSAYLGAQKTPKMNSRSRFGRAKGPRVCGLRQSSRSAIPSYGARNHQPRPPLFPLFITVNRAIQINCCHARAFGRSDAEMHVRTAIRKGVHSQAVA